VVGGAGAGSVGGMLRRGKVCSQHKGAGGGGKVVEGKRQEAAVLKAAVVARAASVQRTPGVKRRARRGGSGRAARGSVRCGARQSATMTRWRPVVGEGGHGLVVCLMKETESNCPMGAASAGGA